MCIEHYLTVLAALSLLYSMYEDLPRETSWNVIATPWGRFDKFMLWAFTRFILTQLLDTTQIVFHMTAIRPTVWHSWETEDSRKECLFCECLRLRRLNCPMWIRRDVATHTQRWLIKVKIYLMIILKVFQRDQTASDRFSISGFFP